MIETYVKEALNIFLTMNLKSSHLNILYVILATLKHDLKLLFTFDFLLFRLTKGLKCRT